MENKSQNVDGWNEEEGERTEWIFVFFNFNCVHRIKDKRNILCCVCVSHMQYTGCAGSFYTWFHIEPSKGCIKWSGMKSRERKRVLKIYYNKSNNEKKAEKLNEKAAHITDTFFHIENEKFFPPHCCCKQHIYMECINCVTVFSLHLLIFFHFVLLSSLSLILSLSIFIHSFNLMDTWNSSSRKSYKNMRLFVYGCILGFYPLENKKKVLWKLIGK